jgi:hypothetical protein
VYPIRNIEIIKSIVGTNEIFTIEIHVHDRGISLRVKGKIRQAFADT